MTYASLPHEFWDRIQAEAKSKSEMLLLLWVFLNNRVNVVGYCTARLDTVSLETHLTIPQVRLGLRSLSRSSLFVYDDATQEWCAAGKIFPRMTAKHIQGALTAAGTIRSPRVREFVHRQFRDALPPEALGKHPEWAALCASVGEEPGTPVPLPSNGGTTGVRENSEAANGGTMGFRNSRPTLINVPNRLNELNTPTPLPPATRANPRGPQRTGGGGVKFHQDPKGPTHDQSDDHAGGADVPFVP